MAPSGWPLEGLGRVWAASGLPLWGVPGPPRQVVPTQAKSRGSVAAALASIIFCCLLKLCVGLLLLAGDICSGGVARTTQRAALNVLGSSLSSESAGLEVGVLCRGVGGQGLATGLSSCSLLIWAFWRPAASRPLHCTSTRWC